MAGQTRKKSPKGAIHEYRKSLRQKTKPKNQNQKAETAQPKEEKLVASEQEVTEGTLKRLHTLGIQKFGSSPFSEHFDRWLLNVEAVLAEFQSNPNVSADEQFYSARSQALSVIKLQLEERRLEEATIEQELANLQDQKTRLKQINIEYAAKSSAVRSRKRSQMKRLYSAVEILKQEQNRITQLKTGFFKGLSRKQKEQKEIAVAQELDNKQRQLEMVLLEFTVTQKELREEYETKKEPVREQIKFFQHQVDALETDGSLEERWFACEALIDVVNSFLQRKANSPTKSLL